MVLEVDAAFVQDIEHRPKPIISEDDGIPLIDLTPLLTTPIPASGDNTIPPALSGLVEEVEAACREGGFFQVINHGVPIELLENIHLAAKEFFALSSEEKQRVKRDEKNPLGYYDTEHTKNVRDWKEVFDIVVNEPTFMPVLSKTKEKQLLEMRNHWPDKTCKEYANSVEILAFKLLELVALTLKLPANQFKSYFKRSASFLCLNHYPPCPSPELALGVGRHNDGGTLTILSQDEVGGLGVKRRSDGEWVRVKPIPNSYIINVGDIIQVWSNDEYESAEHRVSVNSEKERFSVPFFFNPAHYINLKPLEELVSEENPAKYHEYNYTTGDSSPWPGRTATIRSWGWKTSRSIILGRPSDISVLHRLSGCV